VAGYCEISDLFANGLPRGALANAGRLVAGGGGASISANTIPLDQHGLSLNDQFTLRAEGGGSLPAPLVAGTTYYAIPVNDGAFSVAAAADGAAIDLTTPGARILVVVGINYAAAIAYGAALIDDMLPAHLVPLVAPFPPIVTMTCAELAIGKLLQGSGSASKSMGLCVDEARKRLADWARGRPLRGANVPPAANVSVSATVPYRDGRGWSRFGGLP
jgi:hypothetical protein